MDINLRLAAKSDSNMLFAWRNEKSTIPWMANPSPLSLQEHEGWFEEAILNPNILFFIIESDGISIGQIRYQIFIDKKNVKAAKVSINITEEHHGKGVATIAFHKGSLIVRSRGFAEYVFANVIPSNYGSIKAMQKAGFERSKTIVVNNREHLVMIDYLR